MTNPQGIQINCKMHAGTHSVSIRSLLDGSNRRVLINQMALKWACKQWQWSLLLSRTHSWTMPYHDHQKTALANKCDIGTGLSLQLLLFIYPAIRSNVHPALFQTSALKDSIENFGGLRKPVCGTILLTWLKRVCLCSAPACDWIECLYSAGRIPTCNQIPSMTLTWLETLTWLDTRKADDSQGEETLASLSDLTNPTGRS